MRALSVTTILVSPKAVGSGVPAAFTVPDANPWPKALTIDSGASGAPLAKLAAEMQSPRFRRMP